MESKIAEALKMKFNPVAIIWSNEKPEGALQFEKGKWGCIMWMFSASAMGEVAVFDRETFGCWGGGVGLGFGNQYHNFPGGIECFYYFLSVGNKEWETGRMVAEKMKNLARKEFVEEFYEGERCFKTPEQVKRFLEQLPTVDIPFKYVIFKPLKDVDIDREKPVVVVFPVTPHQLSALVILANYGRDGIDNVIVPWAAGCQTIGIFAYKEANSDKPKAVIGLMDISARKYVRKQLGDDIFTFAVPFEMFLEMENNVDGSFLQRPTWLSLVG